MSRCLALLTFLQPKNLAFAGESCLRRWLDFILHFLESSSSSVDLKPSWAPSNLVTLPSAARGFVSRRIHGLEKNTRLLPVVRFLDGERLGDLSDTKRCLKPVEQWPSVRSDTSWPPMRSGTKSASVACDSAFSTPSMKRIFFRDHDCKMVLNGAMGVPKFKRLPDGGAAAFHLGLGAYECLLAACGVTRPCCLLYPALDLLLLTRAKLLQLIRRTWSLRSTCFACLQSGTASCFSRNKSLARCTPVILTNGSLWLSPLFP